MNNRAQSVSLKILRSFKRYINVEAKPRERPGWIKPVGHQTKITLYNPVTDSKVPLILRNKNILRWYLCGPTVYDSAHIGHAATYVKSDIIRRILQDHFDINVVMAMCITDIDDKIIKRCKETDKDFKDLTSFYENEFFDDMKRLNVLRPHLTCRVTDYVPEIIAFVNNIVEAGGAYIAENGSVYFDTNRYDKYGKLSKPFSDSKHPDKKSALDFSLWKAAKEGEPSWESPWGRGRPGWHIECSTIASTVFGNSIDIHSGGVDLTFPHHENEEAQSCCYHNVDQWVNYWLHCGHLFLKGDVKMSKSLKNTVSIEDFLKEYTGNHFRMLCLLSHYRHGIEFADNIMENAVSIVKKLENFIGDCNNYIAGRIDRSNVDENVLLQCLHETQTTVENALADDFDTARAMHSLLKLINLGNKMLHNSDEVSTNRNIAAVAAVSNYVSNIFATFGISQSSMSEEDHKMTNIIDSFVKFRHTVRKRTLEQDVMDKDLLKACDEARANLSSCGIILKDHKDACLWSIKKY